MRFSIASWLDYVLPVLRNKGMAVKTLENIRIFN